MYLYQGQCRYTSVDATHLQHIAIDVAIQVLKQPFDANYGRSLSTVAHSSQQRESVDDELSVGRLEVFEEVWQVRRLSDAVSFTLQGDPLDHSPRRWY